MKRSPLPRLAVLASILVLAACFSSPQPDERKDVQLALGLVRGVGDAILRVKGSAELARSVPELLPLIDVAPTDGILTLAEVEGFLVSVAATPESVTMLVVTVALLRD